MLFGIYFISSPFNGKFVKFWNKIWQYGGQGVWLGGCGCKPVPPSESLNLIHAHCSLAEINLTIYSTCSNFCMICWGPGYQRKACLHAYHFVCISLQEPKQGEIIHAQGTFYLREPTCA